MEFPRWTPVAVKLLLPPRQSRAIRSASISAGESAGTQSRLGIVVLSIALVRCSTLICILVPASRRCAAGACTELRYRYVFTASSSMMFLTPLWAEVWSSSGYRTGDAGDSGSSGQGSSATDASIEASPCNRDHYRSRNLSGTSASGSATPSSNTGNRCCSYV